MLYFPKENRAFSFDRRFFLVYFFFISLFIQCFSKFSKFSTSISYIIVWILRVVVTPGVDGLIDDTPFNDL